jgi:hypothetical protein
MLILWWRCGPLSAEAWPRWIPTAADRSECLVRTHFTDQFGGSKQLSPIPWTGAPGSPKRTWAEKDGAQPHNRICRILQRSIQGSTGCGKTHVLYQGTTLVGP